MDAHFDICRVFEISKFDIARLTCIKKGVFVTEYLDQSMVLRTYRYSASKCKTSDDLNVL